jgi:hypothetical protein
MSSELKNLFIEVELQHRQMKWPTHDPAQPLSKSEFKLFSLEFPTLNTLSRLDKSFLVSLILILQAIVVVL